MGISPRPSVRRRAFPRADEWRQGGRRKFVAGRGAGIFPLRPFPLPATENGVRRKFGECKLLSPSVGNPEYGAVLPAAENLRA